MRRVKCLRRSSHAMSAYVGLDVHKEWAFATVLDQDGRVVVQRKLPNEHVPSFVGNFKVEKGRFGSLNSLSPLVQDLGEGGL